MVEALSREVREETGLDVNDPGRLLYVEHSDDPTEHQIREHRGSGYQAVAFVFELKSWTGDLRPCDPDGSVVQARWLTETDAIDKLQKLEVRGMSEPILAFLRGEVGPSAMWFYRRRSDGTNDLIARIPSPEPHTPYPEP